ncbi:MAG: glycosyltransferase [Spirochaetota bacterium]|nr:glycosyltransferase [Spirochaetota bacterium]
MSIIVTVYNIENYIERCLESLVHQSLQEIEIICVNDGSTDKSLEILNRYAGKYPDMISVFTKENGGGDWGARNFGVKKINTGYFSFVDGDDYVHRDYALKLYSAIDENNADMAICAFERRDAATDKKICSDMDKFGHRIITVDGKDSILAFMNVALWNKVFRASKVKDIEYPAIRVVSDLFLMLAAMPNLEKIVIIPDILYYYMMRRDSLIHNVREADLGAYEKNFLTIKEMYTSNAAYTKFSDYINLMVFMHYGMATIFRLSYACGGAALKNHCARINNFINTEFPGWRSSPFLKFSYCLKKGVKHCALYVIHLLYKMNMSLLFVRIYRFTVDVLKIDIKY